MVTGLKPESRTGQSTGLLVQNNVICLAARDPGCYLGAVKTLSPLGRNLEDPQCLQDCEMPCFEGGAAAAWSSEHSG